MDTTEKEFPYGCVPTEMVRINGFCPMAAQQAVRFVISIPGSALLTQVILRDRRLTPSILTMPEILVLASDEEFMAPLSLA